MEAIVRISGKQYRLSEGQRVTVDRLANPVGEEVTFDDVLMLTDGATATVGSPTVAGAAVTARVVSAARGPKIVVFKYKAKKRYRRTRGHRQEQSILEVLAVSGAGAKRRSDKAEAPKKASTAETAPKAEAAPEQKDKD
jgi:large subunit ribosomal protein L21